MKNSIKLFISAIFCLFTFAILLSCSDNPVNNNSTNNPPTFQDSVIKLYSPSNDAHFNTGDTIRFSWSRGYAYRYGIQMDTTPNINIYGIPEIDVQDTTAIRFVNENSPTVLYWLVVPYHNEFKEEYRSEMRRIFIN